MQTTHPERSLRRDLKEAPGFSALALLLAVLGSAAGAVITSAFGSGHWGTLAGAALGPVISTTFSTKRTGEQGRVRNATIIILSTGALLITVTGFTFADRVAGKSILPGPDPRPATFFALTSNQGTPSATPSASGTAPLDLQVQPAGPLDCGTVAVGADAPCPQPVTITSTGTDVLRITGIEVTGQNGQDFTPSQDCVGASLDPSQTCDLQVRFQPTAAGQRQTTLVIHQNLPWPDQGTKVTLTGVGADGPDPDACLQGYVWREAVPGDHVCVTPETRAQAADDNSLAASRRSPTGGAYGPDTCLQGYVWREAVQGDHVCVTPETRAQAADDNSLAASHRV
jgi:hypothetical protein